MVAKGNESKHKQVGLVALVWPTEAANKSTKKKRKFKETKLESRKRSNTHYWQYKNTYQSHKEIMKQW